MLKCWQKPSSKWVGPIVESLMDCLTVCPLVITRTRQSSTSRKTLFKTDILFLFVLISNAFNQFQIIKIFFKSFNMLLFFCCCYRMKKKLDTNVIKKDLQILTYVMINTNWRPSRDVITWLLLKMYMKSSQDIFIYFFVARVLFLW